MNIALIIIGVALLFFAFCRSFFCWYFKFTEISETLKRIEKKMSE